MSHLDSATDGAGCLRTLALFVLVASPVYWLLRSIARAARAAYGFDAADDAADEAPLVVCAQCHNTVLEAEWTHCPYCGFPLAPPGVGSGAQAADDDPGAPPGHPL